MQMTHLKKYVSLLVCAVLIAAIALFASGCNNTTPPEEENSSVETPSIQATVLGEGETSFLFTVTDGEGKETAFEIHTDKALVGEALQELGLIEGEEGPYGLYVKKVNGITADYDKTGTYWAFYINGEMAPSGVDKTEITPHAEYSFVISK